MVWNCIAPLVLVLNETSTSLARRLIQVWWGQTSGMLASLNTESRKPCSTLNGIEKMRFTISAVVMAKSLNRHGLPRLPYLFCFHSAIASSSIHKVREPSSIKALLYCSQLVVL